MKIDKVLIVSLGSIGKRHLGNINKVLPNVQIAVLRSRRTADDVDGYATIHSIAEAIAFKPQVAFVCNPSSHHIGVAIELASAGIHLFIEKPLSNKLSGLNQLTDIVKSNGLKLMVGYNLRFIPSMIKLRELVTSKQYGRALYVSATAGQYLPDWRPDSDYRQTVSASEELGGGALLELSHELDYLSWLLGDAVSASGQLLKVSELDIDVEDLVLAHIAFGNDTQTVKANIELDFLQRKPSRICKIVCEKATLIWDAIDDRVEIQSKEDDTIYFQGNRDRNHSYEQELSTFFQCIEDDLPSPIPVEDGIRVAKLIDAIRESSETERVIYL